MFADDREHFFRLEMLEARPAEVFVGPAAAVFAFRKDAALDRLLQPVRFVLLQRVKVIEPANEEQVGDLLDDFERVGDAARPKGIPNSVDLIANVAGEHRLRLAEIDEN